METLWKIRVPVEDGKEKILFGIPTTQNELNDMFALRYSVYSERGYIEPNEQRSDRDEYDDDKHTQYFIAKIGEHIVGTVRMIRTTQLPLEKDCYTFDEPEAIRSIPRDKRIEIGRLVSTPLNAEEGIYFPRHVVMLGLLISMIRFAQGEGLQGGYAFVKKGLYTKLHRVRIPVHPIVPAEKIYGKGILHKYFYEGEDVVPLFFLSKEVMRTLRFYTYFLRMPLSFMLYRYFLSR